MERLPIFSFLVYHQESHRYLHHNFVSTLLNDLFGIQSRGGCACAGPYAMVSYLFIFLCQESIMAFVMPSITHFSCLGIYPSFFLPFLPHLNEKSGKAIVIPWRWHPRPSKRRCALKRQFAPCGATYFLLQLIPAEERAKKCMHCFP